MEAYIIKISLKESKPLVWRRIIMPAGANYKRLHDVIQRATNFQSGYPYGDYHLYEFDLREDSIKVTNDEDEYYEYLDIRDNRKAYEEELKTMPSDPVSFKEILQEKLDTVVRKPTGFRIDDYLKKHGVILYRYDFGDGWQFTVELENTVDDYYLGYPALLDGEETAPPEDVGESRDSMIF